MGVMGKTNADIRRDRRAEERRAAIRRALKERGLSRQKACELAGLKNANALGNFLTGRTRSLNLDTLEPLARVLNMTISELVGEIPPGKRMIVVDKADNVLISSSNLDAARLTAFGFAPSKCP